MKLHILLILLISNALARAELPFKLPAKAKYTASTEAIAQARADLMTNLVADATTLTNLFSSPMICGPGLWDVLKSSPQFAKPPMAKSTAEIPLRKGKVQKMPMAFLQSDSEVASFRNALADLVKSQGSLTVREPTKDEFLAFWAVIPFEEISAPMLVAEGKDITIFCNFGKQKVFWADEVKRLRIRK